MTAPRVLSVGQCGYDHGRLTRYLRESFGAETEGVDTFDEALERLRSGAFRLVLVNRLLDLDHSNGIDLIRSIRADPGLAGVPAMLVSNYPEAQAQAADLGALRGFGKGDLGKPRARDALSAALAPAGVDHRGG
jgi:two-component system, chemotaxis family, chemotaxis protein CheY